LTTIVEGIPAGLKLSADQITCDLQRRQLGYGRGERMRIEDDRAIITSGIWCGNTIGSPITVQINNRDWENWKDQKFRKRLAPRPGHADLVGYLKYDLDDIQMVIERASARETAARVAAGSIARQYLDRFKIRVYSHTRQIGSARNEKPLKLSAAKWREIESSSVRCADKAAGAAMLKGIDEAIAHMDTLGGVAEVVVTGVPLGLGSYAQWDRRTDARLAAAVMSAPSVKAVEIGVGIDGACKSGSAVHDAIRFDNSSGFVSDSNNAGGIIGGVSTGQEIVIRAYFKPLSTLGNPLDSVNLLSKQRTKAPYVRSDTCIVPAGGVVCEGVVALVLADLMSEKFGGDSMREALSNYQSYLSHVRAR
jgi:chorismate synthase